MTRVFGCVCLRIGVKTTYTFVTLSHSITYPEPHSVVLWPQCSMSGRHTTSTVLARTPPDLHPKLAVFPLLHASGKCLKVVRLRSYFEILQRFCPPISAPLTGWAVGFHCFWLEAGRSCGWWPWARHRPSSTSAPCMGMAESGGGVDSGLVVG